MAELFFWQYLNFRAFLPIVASLSYLFFTNYMELNSSTKGTNHPATQEFSKIIWYSKIDHRVHKMPPLVPILSQISSILNYLRSIPILSSHLCLSIPNSLFPSGSLQNLACNPLQFHSGYMHCLSHPSGLKHYRYIWQRGQIVKLIRELLSSW
jgi:hypothetical protein